MDSHFLRGMNQQAEHRFGRAIAKKSCETLRNVNFSPYRDASPALAHTVLSASGSKHVERRHIEPPGGVRVEKGTCIPETDSPVKPLIRIVSNGQRDAVQISNNMVCSVEFRRRERHHYDAVNLTPRSAVSSEKSSCRRHVRSPGRDSLLPYATPRTPTHAEQSPVRPTPEQMQLKHITTGRRHIAEPRATERAEGMDHVFGRRMVQEPTLAASVERRRPTSAPFSDCLDYGLVVSARGDVPPRPIVNRSASPVQRSFDIVSLAEKRIATPGAAASSQKEHVSETRSRAVRPPRFAFNKNQSSLLNILSWD
jgi:hypothetical protein